MGRFSVVLLGDSSPPDASLTAMIAVFVLNQFLSLLVAVDGGAGARGGGGGVGAVREGKLQE